MPFTLGNLKAYLGVEILVIGAPNPGDAPHDDVEGRRDWWVD